MSPLQSSLDTNRNSWWNTLYFTRKWRITYWKIKCLSPLLDPVDCAPDLKWGEREGERSRGIYVFLAKTKLYTYILNWKQKILCYAAKNKFKKKQRKESRMWTPLRPETKVRMGACACACERLFQCVPVANGTWKWHIEPAN